MYDITVKFTEELSRIYNHNNVRQSSFLEITDSICVLIDTIWSVRCMIVVCYINVSECMIYDVNGQSTQLVYLL